MRISTPGRRSAAARTGLWLVVLTTLLAIAAPLAAQQLPRPSLLVTGDSIGGADLDNPPLAALANSNAKVGTSNLLVAAQYPVVLDHGRKIWFFDASYQRREFDLRHWPDGVSRDLDRLHEISFGVTYRTMLGETWAVIVNGTGQIQSNLEGDDLADGDFKVQGAIIFERPFGQTWNWGFGVAYASTFGEQLPLPVITFRYDAGGRWHAEGSLPASAAIWYRVTQASEVGLNLQASGSHYHIPAVFPADRDIDDPQLEYILVKAGPEFAHFMDDWGRLSVGAGLSYQMLGLFDGKDELPDSRYDLKPDLYVSVGLAYIF